MNAIRQFAETIWRQYYFLRDCRELDDYYVDQDQRHWKQRGQRRGWTRQDILRQKQFYEAREKQTDPPSLFEYSGNPATTRIQTAFKLWRFEFQADIKRRSAMQFCQQHQEFSVDEPSIIHRMSRIHSEILGYIRSEYDAGASAIDEEWVTCYRELERVIKAIELSEIDPEIEAGEYFNQHPEIKVSDILNKFGITVSEKTWRERMVAKNFRLNHRTRGKKAQN